MYLAGERAGFPPGSCDMVNDTLMLRGEGKLCIVQNLIVNNRYMIRLMQIQYAQFGWKNQSVKSVSRAQSVEQQKLQNCYLAV